MSYTNEELVAMVKEIYCQPSEPRTYKFAPMGIESKKKWDAVWMHEWFKHLFEQRIEKFGCVPCFECGKPMHEDTYKDLTTCYSHILGKKQYSKYAGYSENVVIVHPDCHNLYTMKPKEAKNQYALYLKLKEKYGIA